MTRQELSIEYVDPATLVSAPNNPRKMTDDALRGLAMLMDSHGWVDPIIARRRDGLIIGGHQRLKANLLREAPDEYVPVVFLDDIDDARAAALNVALNNRQTQGDYDYPKLADLLEEIDTSQLDAPALTGFSEDDLAGLIRRLDECGPDVRPDIEVNECFQVAAVCETEQAQRELYERLTAEGYTCRLSVL